MSTTGFAKKILVFFINTNENISLILLVRTQPNFDGWLVRSSVLMGNCLGDMEPGNIFQSLRMYGISKLKLI